MEGFPELDVPASHWGNYVGVVATTVVGVVLIVVTIIILSLAATNYFPMYPASTPQVCSAGQQWSMVAQRCMICPEGTYQTVGSWAACIPCPGRMVPNETHTLCERIAPSEIVQ